MKSKMKMASFAAVVGVLLSPVVSAGGIPVFDGIGQTQRILQIQHAVEQVAELQNQLQVARQQYDNMSGITGLGDLLPEELDALASTLPPEWQTVYQDMKAGDELSGDARHIWQDDRDAVSSRSVDEANEYVRQQRDQQYAIDESMAAGGYDAQLQRVEDLKTAVRALNQSSTAKEVMDLQTRTQITMASIELERNKYMLADMLSRAHERRLQMQAREVHRRRFHGDRESSDNSIGDIRPHFMRD